LNEAIRVKSSSSIEAFFEKMAQVDILIQFV